MRAEGEWRKGEGESGAEGEWRKAEGESRAEGEWRKAEGWGCGYVCSVRAQCGDDPSVELLSPPAIS